MALNFGQLKKLLLILVLSAYSFAFFGQEAERVPEFLEEYKNAKSDSSRSYALGWACYHSAYSNPEQGVNYGRQACTIAVRTKDERQLANFYNNMGLCFDSWGKTDSSEIYYQKSIQILEKFGLKCEAANALANIGNLQRKTNRVAEALKTYSSAAAMQERCEDKRYFCSTMQSIGACYNAMKDYHKSIEYFKKALDFARLYNDSSAICNVHHGAANAYLGLHQLDSARHQYLTALTCYQSIGNTYHEAYTYEGLSELAAEEDNIDSALFYCHKALKVYEGMGAKTDIVYIKQLTAQHLSKAKRHADAKKILLEAIPIAEEQNLYHYLQEMIFLLSQTEAGLGNYKDAYNYRLRSDQLQDSLKINDEKAELERLAAKYETEKRDRQIVLEQTQKQTLQLENDKQKQQKYFLLIGIILLALLVLGLINRSRQKQRTAKELAAKNTIIEREKERAERSEKVKQQFLANMSHEIRTPVNAINGLSRLLLEKQHDKQTSDYLKAINHSGENLLVVLNDILDLSKLEADKMQTLVEPFNLREEVEAVIQVFAERANEKRLLLESSIDNSIPEIAVGDAARLTQVLANLISNAIKFTDNGSVVVRLKKSDETNISFTVSDTGRGIPTEKQHEVFENFAQADNQHTREHGGTGLGLPIAKKLVEVMGGTMQLKSTAGEGSEFSFVLPLIANAVVKSKEKVELIITEKELHIVVAEDNEYNFWVTEGTLQKYFPNATVYRALNGEEVLRLWEEDEYDLILMDVQMPLLDGIEATKHIRLSDGKTPILGLTASVVQDEIERCLQVGMNSYVMKPFDVATFVTTIRSVLGIEDGTMAMSDDATSAMERNALFIKLIPKKLSSLIVAIESKDMSTTQRSLHAMRPQLMHNGLVQFETDFIFIESAQLWNEDLQIKLHAIVLAIEEKLEEYQSNAHS